MSIVKIDGEKTRNLIFSMGMGLSGFSKKAGLSHTVVGKAIERGTCFDSTAYRIASALGINDSYLVIGKADKKKSSAKKQSEAPIIPCKAKPTFQKPTRVVVGDDIKNLLAKNPKALETIAYFLMEVSEVLFE